MKHVVMCAIGVLGAGLATHLHSAATAIFAGLCFGVGFMRYWGERD